MGSWPQAWQGVVRVGTCAGSGLAAGASGFTGAALAGQRGPKLEPTSARCVFVQAQGTGAYWPSILTGSGGAAVPLTCSRLEASSRRRCRHGRAACATCGHRPLRSPPRPQRQSGHPNRPHAFATRSSRLSKQHGTGHAAQHHARHFVLKGRGAPSRSRPPLFSSLGSGARDRQRGQQWVGSKARSRGTKCWRVTMPRPVGTRDRERLGLAGGASPASTTNSTSVMRWWRFQVKLVRLSRCQALQHAGFGF